MRLERDWSEAFRRHDVKAIDRIVADDFAGIDSRGVSSDKAAELAEAAAPAPGAPPPDFEVLEETFSDMRVRVYGNTAVLTSTNDMKARFRGKDINPKYRRTTVWVRRNGRWQVVAFHATRLP